MLPFNRIDKNGRDTKHTRMTFQLFKSHKLQQQQQQQQREIQALRRLHKLYKQTVPLSPKFKVGKLKAQLSIKRKKETVIFVPVI